MKPILFSTQDVKALLNTKPGTWPSGPIDPSRPCKSQTRRVAEMPPAVQGRDYRYDGLFEEGGDGCHYLEETVNGEPTERYLNVGNADYQVGDRLWVWETFCKVPYKHPSHKHAYTMYGHITTQKTVYKADSDVDYTGMWIPPSKMPRKAALACSLRSRRSGWRGCRT